MKYITHVATSLWKETEKTTLFSKKMLHIAGLLHNSHIDPHLITLPRLVVVGTQSSGKSSLLNSIMGMDILPVGVSMTTRTPITLELIPSSDSRIECGSYVDATWTIDRTIPIHYPLVTPDEKETVRGEIEKQTIQRAGNECNISAHCITLKIYAPSLPPLTMTDLPGLVSVAITDRGQPKDMKEQLRELVKTYTSSPSTLIMAIIAARPDIEADMSMELIKQIDPNGERTIGILTKLDLMNHDSDIRCYLENKVSRDLQLTHGYFGVRNKNYPTIAETISSEKAYLQSHPVYQQPHYQSRLGIPNVSSSLSSILLQAISAALPAVLAALQQKEDEITQELSVLGTSIPLQKEVRSSIVQELVHQFTKQYVHALEGRGSGHSTGTRIHDVITSYRTQLLSANPFTHVTDSYVSELRSSYDGLHMRFSTMPVEVLEQCLTDSRHRPIYQLVEPSRACVQNTLDLLYALQHDLLELPTIRKYPLLVKQIRIVMTELYTSAFQLTMERIRDIVLSEEAYIWTDDAAFHKVATKESFLHIVKAYYHTIVSRLQDTIPKLMVYHLITCSNRVMQRSIYEKIMQGDVMAMVEEAPEVEQRRKVLETQKRDIVLIKKKMEECR